MLCGKPEEGGIDVTEGVLHSFNKEWRTYCVLDARNAEINGTQTSGKTGT